jgi:hypothetical protein
MSLTRDWHDNHKDCVPPPLLWTLPTLWRIMISGGPRLPRPHLSSFLVVTYELSDIGDTVQSRHRFPGNGSGVMDLNSASSLD